MSISKLDIYVLVVDGDEISTDVFTSEQDAIDSLRSGWLSEEDREVSDLDLFQYIIDTYGVSLYLTFHQVKGTLS